MWSSSTQSHRTSSVSPVLHQRHWAPVWTCWGVAAWGAPAPWPRSVGREVRGMLSDTDGTCLREARSVTQTAHGLGPSGQFCSGLFCSGSSQGAYIGCSDGLKALRPKCWWELTKHQSNLSVIMLNDMRSREAPPLQLLWVQPAGFLSY